MMQWGRGVAAALLAGLVLGAPLAAWAQDGGGPDDPPGEMLPPDMLPPDDAPPPGTDPSDEGTAPAADESVPPGTGPVTHMPLPRFVSLKAAEGNARRGPGLSHRIDWEFRLRDMPLMVTAEFGNWRRVEDRDGQGGWIHYTLLSGVRTVIVTADMADLRTAPTPESAVVARAENGVVGRLGACQPDWCRITAGGERGWVAKADIWGVTPTEVRE